ncbi:hypothetical protein [Lewinella sp. 4G2]|uniref:hypothetical protein n=1 Tax=Lewinella sp. 4G2 TaxID=1803372 RepID=UPI0007B4E0D7|nr:hypothetical protein [Lewinella sp. 4G2]OAV44846.1 hypothetical protein A3850_010240 [Lewinella sp. 4G2]
MPTTLRTPHYLSIAAVIIWTIYLLLDYLGFHGRMLKDFLAFPYAGLVGTYVVLGGVASFLAHRKLSKTEGQAFQISFRGISVYGLVLLTALCSIAAFSLAERLPQTGLSQRLFYFTAYGTYHVAGLFILATSAFGIGSVLLSRYRERLKSSFNLISIALGISVLGILFAIIGLTNLLIPIVCWIVIAVGIGIGYKSVLGFLINTLWTKKKITISRAWVPAVLVALVAILGVTFVGAFKTFPVGFDGAALYLNTAMLTADSGGLPYGGQAFAWSVMMGVGDILFGSLTMGILLSHLMNVLCLLMLYRVARIYLSESGALLACLLVLIAPFFVFHSLVDEKVDLAFTFISLAAFYLATVLTNPFNVMVASDATTVQEAQEIETGPSTHAQSSDNYVWLLLGLLVGFAFTIKYTAIIFVLALGGYWLYQRAGKIAFLGSVLGSVGFLFFTGVYRLGYISMPRAESLAFGGATLVLGLAFIAYAFRKNITAGIGLAKGIGLFTASFLLTFAPWGIKNVAENGSVSVNHLIQGESVAPSLDYIHQLSFLDNWGTPEFYFTHQSPSVEQPTFQFAEYDQQPAAEAPAEEASSFEINQGAREDVQRYLGYEAPFWRYFSLPYDMTVNSNLSSRLVDIGWLGLLLLPIILLIAPGGSIKWAKLALLVPILIYLAAVLYSLYERDGEILQKAIWVDMEKRFITTQVPGSMRGIVRAATTPLLNLSAALSGTFKSLGELPLSAVFTSILGVGLLLTLGAKRRLASLPVRFRQFGAFLSIYAILFWIMGNGVIWYAMPLFVLAPVFLVWFFDRPDRFLGPGLARFTSVFGSVVIGLTIFVQGALYFTSPFESEGDPAGLFRYPFVEMATSSDMNERKVQAAFNPASNEILDALNADMDDKIYRVATQLGHFIKQNDRRVFSDPVLTRYDEIASRLRPGEEEKFFDMLKAQGYKYVLFDLNLGAVDRTPEQTLKKKFLSLARAIFSTKKLKLVSTDNYVADPKAPVIMLPDGKRANARRRIKGKTVFKGSVILMEIK